MNECDKSCAVHGEANVDCARHGEVAVLRAQVDSLGEALHGAARSLLWVARNRDADGNEVRAYAESRATVASNALDRIRALAPVPDCGIEQFLKSPSDAPALPCPVCDDEIQEKCPRCGREP